MIGRGWREVAVLVSVVVTPGCGGDDAGESSAGDAATGAVDNSGGSDGTGMDGDAVDGSDADGDGGADTTAGDDGVGDSGMGDDGNTTGAGECAGLDSRECEANPECVAVSASPVVMTDDGGYCSQGSVYAGCLGSSLCGAAITYACPRGTDEVHVIAWTCVPEGWQVCEAPAETVPACP